MAAQLARPAKFRFSAEHGHPLCGWRLTATLKNPRHRKVGGFFLPGGRWRRLRTNLVLASASRYRHVISVAHGPPGIPPPRSWAARSSSAGSTSGSRRDQTGSTRLRHGGARALDGRAQSGRADHDAMLATATAAETSALSASSPSQTEGLHVLLDGGLYAFHLSGTWGRPPRHRATERVPGMRGRWPESWCTRCMRAAMDAVSGCWLARAKASSSKAAATGERSTMTTSQCRQDNAVLAQARSRGVADPACV